MVVSGGTESRKQIVNIVDGMIMQRDDSHRVLRLNTVLTIDS